MFYSVGSQLDELSSNQTVFNCGRVAADEFVVYCPELATVSSPDPVLCYPSGLRQR